jgi:hypothetical protein
MSCGCWDCLRAAGETPSSRERPFFTAGELQNRGWPEGRKRTGLLYQGASERQLIPMDADIVGHDRPRNRLQSR